MNELGITIKQLQRKYQLTGQELAKRVGITGSNLSQIVRGHAKPRQGTFTSLCKELAQTPEDEKLLVDAFVRVKEGVPETVVVNTEQYEQAENERAERYLEVKAQSIAFKKSVARELDKLGFSYEQDYCEGIYVTDFLVIHEGRRIALECKFNVHRDFEKTVRIAGILKVKLNCEGAFIVLPYADDVIYSREMPQGISIITVSEIQFIS